MGQAIDSQLFTELFTLSTWISEIEQMFCAHIVNKNVDKIK